MLIYPDTTDDNETIQPNYLPYAYCIQVYNIFYVLSYCSSYFMYVDNFFSYNLLGFWLQILLFSRKRSLLSFSEKIVHNVN